MRPAAGPRNDAVGHVVEQRAPLARAHLSAAGAHAAAVGGQHAAEAIEQRGLTGAIRPDEPQQFPRLDMETDIAKGFDPAESLAQPVNLKQHESNQNSGMAAGGAMICERDSNSANGSPRATVL